MPIILLNLRVSIASLSSYYYVVKLKAITSSTTKLDWFKLNSTMDFILLAI
jgi:hypothetical protein